jgi:hypothetical protein
MMAPPSEGILFEEDWESGTGQWSAFPSEMTIITDSDFGAGNKVLRILNGADQNITTNSAFIPGKPTVITLEFSISIRDLDDAGFFRLKTTDGTEVVIFTPARAAGVNAARKTFFATDLGSAFITTLTAGVVYKAVMTYNWTSGFASCEVFQGVTSQGSTGDLAFTTGLDINEVLIESQPATPGDARYSDIKVTL